jgi:hypothetical protein
MIYMRGAWCTTFMWEDHHHEENSSSVWSLWGNGKPPVLGYVNPCSFSCHLLSHMVYKLDNIGNPVLLLLARHPLERGTPSWQWWILRRRNQTSLWELASKEIPGFFKFCYLAILHEMEKPRPTFIDEKLDIWLKIAHVLWVAMRASNIYKEKGGI